MGALDLRAAGARKRARDERIRHDYGICWHEWIALGGIIAHAQEEGFGVTAKELHEAGARVLTEVFDAEPWKANIHTSLLELERQRLIVRDGSPPYRYVPTRVGLSRWREGRA
jgi:hypothetical protein